MAGTQLVTVRVGAVTLPGIADLIGSTGSLYATGNTIGQTTSTSGAPGGLTFSGAGVVSVGFSSGSIIIGATVPSATSATSMGWSAVGNTTGASSTTRPLTAQTLSGAGGITVGYSAGSIVISGPVAGAASATSRGQSAVGNTTGLTSSQSAPITAATISGAGVVSVGFSNGTLLISAPAAAASATSMGQSAIGNTTGLTSSQTAALTAAIISGGGIVSVGYSAGTLLISAPAVIASATSLQSSALGNTTGQSSSTTLSLTAGAISGAGIVSVGFSAGTLVVSAPAGAASATSLASSAIGNTTGQSSSTTLPLTAGAISGAGIVSVGFSAGSLVISAAAGAQSVQTIGGFATGNTTAQSSSTTFDARSVTISGAGGVSVGYSAANVLVISGASAGAAGAALSYYEQPMNVTGTRSAFVGLGMFFVAPAVPPQPVSFNAAGAVHALTCNNFTVSIATAAGSAIATASRLESNVWGLAVWTNQSQYITYTLSATTTIPQNLTISCSYSRTGASCTLSTSMTVGYGAGSATATLTSSGTQSNGAAGNKTFLISAGLSLSISGTARNYAAWATSLNTGVNLIGVGLTGFTSGTATQETNFAWPASTYWACGLVYGISFAGSVAGVKRLGQSNQLASYFGAIATSGAGSTAPPSIIISDPPTTFSGAPYFDFASYP